MEWVHKNCVITVNDDGLFEFNINKTVKYADSLKDAREKIDCAFAEQYHFSESDIKVLLSKLNKKEKGFVEDMLTELNCHSNSAYCELGLSDMQYTFEWKKWRD